MAFIIPIGAMGQEVTAEGTLGFFTSWFDFEPTPQYRNHQFYVDAKIPIPKVGGDEAEFPWIPYFGQSPAYVSREIWVRRIALIELFDIPIQQLHEPIMFRSRLGHQRFLQATPPHETQ
jgi:hypothetical protein